MSAYYSESSHLGAINIQILSHLDCLHCENAGFSDWVDRKATDINHQLIASNGHTRADCKPITSAQKSHSRISINIHPPQVISDFKEPRKLYNIKFQNNSEFFTTSFDKDNTSPRVLLEEERHPFTIRNKRLTVGIQNPHDKILTKLRDIISYSRCKFMYKLIEEWSNRCYVTYRLTIEHDTNRYVYRSLRANVVGKYNINGLPFDQERMVCDLQFSERIILRADTTWNIDRKRCGQRKSTATRHQADSLLFRRIHSCKIVPVIISGKLGAQLGHHLICKLLLLTNQYVLNDLQKNLGWRSSK
ncbi:hypothetical protein CLV71_126114 [Actinophytocola oryzae]|uniref:Uncharacterized protein n=1 Tax=Actinophytocola oryzae TaxID=502181 RepID=A0A4R7UT27_9PSEU|nr:hypothetical protein CLV71_126114 [Actinophytocola oryzae]